MNRRRRGRPPALLAESLPAGGPDLDADLRTGWLLRSWRLHLAPDSNARGFAATLSSLGRPADASRVSRWETGRVPAPSATIAAYEEALALPHGALVALAMVTRELAQPRGDLGQVLDPQHVPPARYQAALDVACQGGPCGGDWLDLACFVATHPDRAILPSSVWRSLAGRLVHELTISVGAAYATRSRAALLLSRHEAARGAVVVAVGEHVTDNESLLVADAIALLQPIEDPRAGALVIRLLDHPDRTTRTGAVLTAAAKLARGHFADEEMADLEHAVVDLARRHGVDSGGLFARLADVVRVMPPSSAERVRRAVPALGRAGPTTPSARPRGLLGRVSRQVSRPDGQPEEPMLELLVEEALSHDLVERRFQAALSIALSPYRARVARGAARLLREQVEGDPVLAERALVLLTLVATRDEQDQLRALAEDPSSPQHVGALVALAHIPPSGVPAPVDLWALKEPHRADHESVRASIYYAGMTGDRLLGRVQEDPRQPDRVRAAARWWLREGPAIHEQPPLV